MFTQQELNAFFELLNEYISAQHDATVTDPLKKIPSTIIHVLTDNPHFANSTHPDWGPALHYVAHYNNTRLVALLCEYGANVEHCNSQGATVAHILAHTDKVGDSLKVILDYNANPLQDNNAHQITPLHLAETTQNTVAIKLFTAHLDKGTEYHEKRAFFKLIDAYIKDAKRKEHGTITLNQLRLKKIQKTLEENPAYVDLTTPDGTPLLHDVAKSNNLTLFSLLCHKGANTRAYDETGKPLCNILATRDFSGYNIKIALQYGANPLQKHQVTQTNAIQIARQIANTEAEVLFQAYKPKRAAAPPQISPFFELLKKYEQATIGQKPYLLSMIEAALQKENNVHTCDAQGLPALHYAILIKAPALIDLLCRHGAQISQMDSFGVTALMRAAHQDTQGDCITVLLKYATPEAITQRIRTVYNKGSNQSRRDLTALDFAKQVRNQAALKLLDPLHDSDSKAILCRPTAPIKFETSPQTVQPAKQQAGMIGLSTLYHKR